MAVGLANSLSAIKPVRSVRERYRKDCRGFKRTDRSAKTCGAKLEGLASTVISWKSRADPRKVIAPVVVCKSHANSKATSEAGSKEYRKVPQNVQSIIRAMSCAVLLSWALKMAKQFGVITLRVLRASTVRTRAALAPLAVFLVWAAHAAPSALASGGFGPRAGAGAAQAAAWHEVSAQLLGGSALLLALAFFSLSETSITTLWPWKVRELAEKEGDSSPFHLVKSDISRFLTTILIGSTISAIGATALVTDAAFKVLGEGELTMVTVVLTLVTLIFCEIAPKSIAVQHAAVVARFVIRPIAWLAVILYPIGRVSTWICNCMFFFMSVKASGEPFVTEEELKLVLSGATKSGSLPVEEHDMINRVLDLEETPVREIMTPLVDIVAVESESNLEELRQLWLEHQFSRIPIYHARIDNIVGIAYCHTMLQYTQSASLSEQGVAHMPQKPPYFVPESMSVWSLMREFRIRKTHMAVVVNEYGGTVGIVTLEDTMEEIIGEIYDETDTPEDGGNIICRGNGVYDVDAKASIDELRERLDLDIEDGRYETVAGYCGVLFGCIPPVWENVEVRIPELPTDDEEEMEEEKKFGEEHPGPSEALLRITITDGNSRQVRSARFEFLVRKGMQKVVSKPAKKPMIQLAANRSQSVSNEIVSSDAPAVIEEAADDLKVVEVDPKDVMSPKEQVKPSS